VKIGDLVRCKKAFKYDYGLSHRLGIIIQMPSALKYPHNLVLLRFCDTIEIPKRIAISMDKLIIVSK